MSPSYDLRPVWDGILDLYARFDAYCKKHQLRYYVTGGTLLGAVRHNGFIPWDDDFDVVMPRPDYIRFLEMVRMNPIADACVYAREFDRQWRLMFAKVCDSRMNYVDKIKVESNLNLSDGICIDVIPIDGMPKCALPFYFWSIKRSVWRHHRAPGLLWRLLWVLMWGGERDDADPLRFQDWLASYSYETSPAVDDYNGSFKRFKKRILTAESFGEAIWHRFDKTQVPMPREWDKFLKLIYGNYMRLPPIECRLPSHQSFRECS